MTAEGLATRLSARIDADPRRVLAQLFVPGHHLGDGAGRPSSVVEHVLALPEAEVRDLLADLVRRFGDRHRDLARTFGDNAERIGNRLDPGADLSDDRWLLLGATFTHEYSVEAAAVCNPSAVLAPDQSGLEEGDVRFLLSVRQIGEGHRSSIGFRTGVLDRRGQVAMEDTPIFTSPASIEASVLTAAGFASLAHTGLDDAEATRWVLDRLDPEFTSDELDERLTQLECQRDTCRDVFLTAERMRALARRSYTARFGPDVPLSERTLWPAIAIEANGMEDARFVRFVEEDGTVTYHAPYTAFDGLAISQQLLTTTDFLTFGVSPLVGSAAANKGMALFPRRIGGQFAALSRHDGASSSIATSDDLRRWTSATPVACPSSAWEAVQIGNCGSPIETDEGWLVLTHGVGPMRTYAIGAWLLDRDDPTRVIGRLRSPLLSPTAEEQDGYVPNVVYSCGALLHGDRLLVPYGIGDAWIGFATVSLPGLLAALRAGC